MLPRGGCDWRHRRTLGRGTDKARGVPPGAGTFLLHVDFLHWATNRVLATRTIPVIAR